MRVMGGGQSARYLLPYFFFPSQEVGFLIRMYVGYMYIRYIFIFMLFIYFKLVQEVYIYMLLGFAFLLLSPCYWFNF